MTFHPIAGQHALPETFNNPFSYVPHPLSLLAAEEVKRMIVKRSEWAEEVSKGKMFGVLVVQDDQQRLGFLAAYSGQIGGRSDWEGFVPAVFDYLQPDGYFKKEEAEISKINHRIASLAQQPEYIEAIQKLTSLKEEATRNIEDYKEKMRQAKVLRDQERAKNGNDAGKEEERIGESQFMKAELRRLKQRFKRLVEAQEEAVGNMESKIKKLKDERKSRSDQLQRWLFTQFMMLNVQGERRHLLDIFASTEQHIPPAGTGECCAPKLLQYAFAHRMKPICIAEFWIGQSPKTEIRREGYFYPACQGKCKPTLGFMLQGMDVGKAHLQEVKDDALEVVYEDEYIVVVNKPAGMLSVPGKTNAPSVYSIMREKYPDSLSPLIVHRLDMATSGLLMIAKTKDCHKLLQEAFRRHEVRKRYVAWLNGVLPPDKEEGVIDLPLSPDYMDRPRQRVDREHGKTAVTRYKVIRRDKRHTLIALYPLTGRTHQLRIHCAHPDGLNTPIVGDMLYGKPSTRLYLHAEMLTFRHPITGVEIEVRG